MSRSFDHRPISKLDFREPQKIIFQAAKQRLAAGVRGRIGYGTALA
jgi:hypothetical protein